MSARAKFLYIVKFAAEGGATVSYGVSAGSKLEAEQEALVAIRKGYKDAKVISVERQHDSKRTVKRSQEYLS